MPLSSRPSGTMSSLSRMSEKCRPPPNPPPPRLKPEGERGVIVCERLTLACCCPLVRGWRGLYVGARRPVISCPLVDARVVVVCERLVVPCPLCVADALEFGLVVWPVGGLAPLDAGWLELGWLAVLFCRSVIEAFGAHGAGGPAVEEAGWVLPIAGMPAFGVANGGIGVEAKGAGADIAALGRGVAAAAVADTVPLLDALVIQMASGGFRAMSAATPSGEPALQSLKIESPSGEKQHTWTAPAKQAGHVSEVFVVALVVVVVVDWVAAVDLVGGVDAGFGGGFDAWLGGGFVAAAVAGVADIGVEAKGAGADIAALGCGVAPALTGALFGWQPGTGTGVYEATAAGAKPRLRAVSAMADALQLSLYSRACWPP
jgi:hypothetical protein